jgi:hypothetical protein
VDTFSEDDFDRLVDANIVGGGTDAPDVSDAPDAPSRLTGHWVPETLADAYADNTPIEFLIEGLLPVPSLSIVYGGPGSLKSMLLADLAVCVAAGKVWLEPLPGDALGGVSFVTKQAPVLWLDFDNGKKRTRRRMAALGRGHEQPPDASLHYISMAIPWLDASDDSMMREVQKFVADGHYKLVIIDNLGLVNGGVEENSSEMSVVMSKLRSLSEAAECAVIVIHHQRKNSTNGSDPGTRKGDTLRGHSTIEASLDMALLIERKGREDAILAVPTKTRDFHRFDFFGALWTFEHYADDDRLRTGRFWARSVATGEEAVNMAIMQVIKNEMRGHGWMGGPEIINLTRDTMAARPGGKPAGINKVRGLLRQMADDGQILTQGKARNVEYCLP